MMDIAQTYSIEAFAEEIGGGFIGKFRCLKKAITSIFP